jgi:hypothetical protein
VKAEKSGHEKECRASVSVISVDLLRLAFITDRTFLDNSSGSCNRIRLLGRKNVIGNVFGSIRLTY